MRLIAIILLLFLTATVMFAYIDGTVLARDRGATALTINNSGPLGGSSVLYFPNTGSQRIKVWMSPARYANRGSELACPNPCTQSLPTEYGKGLYMYEVTDSNGFSFTPPKLSAALDIPFAQAPCSSAPFVVPVPVHGFKDYTTCFSFSVAAGTDVSALRIWLNTFNLRQNIGSVFVNSQPEKILSTTPIVGLTSTGSVCTGTTATPHGLLPNDLVQLNGFTNVAGGLVGVALMNNSFTVIDALTKTTFTVACSVSAAFGNDCDTGFAPRGRHEASLGNSGLRRYQRGP